MLRRFFYRLIKHPVVGKFCVKRWRPDISQEELDTYDKVVWFSRSGGIIAGLWGESLQDASKATIVLGHPMRRAAKAEFLKNGYALVLRKNGYNVLLYDINGFGESTVGDFNYDYDIDSAFVFAKQQTPHLPIGFHGVSLSANWGIIAMAKYNHGLDCAILECPLTDQKEFWKYYPKKEFYLNLVAPFFSNIKGNWNIIAKYETITNLKNVLFIYSENDIYTPIEMGQEFVRKSKVKTEFWNAGDTPHAETMKHKPIEFAQKTVQFFDENLAQA